MFFLNMFKCSKAIHDMVSLASFACSGLKVTFSGCTILWSISFHLVRYHNDGQSSPPWYRWLCGVGAGTFEAPFKVQWPVHFANPIEMAEMAVVWQHTSNGYFAEWLGFFCSLYYMIVVVVRHT